uniref:Reverse transcriptase domain-containing protein n=1 Tax=Nelumbo nucifera TaxID=4432 RepID=A0A822ZGM1_NELNU|nr:TPA_asm: hypothetical protein HUJ06_002512 [Nelumbo nucifera]
MVTHLAFADDLFIFLVADPTSTFNLHFILDMFFEGSGLQVNNAKSQVFFSSVSEEDHVTILNTLGMSSGSLPIIYLGFPLTSTRLFDNDCLPLIKEIDNTTHSWNSESLSYAGILELFRSGITSKILF